MPRIDEYLDEIGSYIELDEILTYQDDEEDE